jgi:hypothetical protein
MTNALQVLVPNEVWRWGLLEPLGWPPAQVAPLALVYEGKTTTKRRRRRWRTREKGRGVMN